MLGTLADHTTIRPGDLVFFFQRRNIYGIGEVIDPYDGAPATRGVLTNYSQALLANAMPVGPNEAALGPQLDAQWADIRLVVPFVPSPAFFPIGIDMDEVLSSPGAEAAWGLRFWQGTSFKQLGEDETRVLLQVFLRRFGNGTPMPPLAGPTRTQLRAMFNPAVHAPFEIGEMVATSPAVYVDGDELKHEFVLHGLLVEALDPFPGRTGDLATPLRLDVYREIAASPPKPSIYKDSVDVMGTRRFDGGPALSVHHELVEVKAHTLPYGPPSPQTFDGIMTQLMKYVDFVAEHYAGGNYSAVSATYVAYDFSQGIRAAWAAARTQPTVVTTRSYVLNPRQNPPTLAWNDLRLMTYRWSQTDRRIRITVI